MTNILDVVLFSKDRASQTTACLQSFEKNFAEYDKVNVTVLYRATNDNFEKGYEKAKTFFDDKVRWVKEYNFENQLKEIVNNIQSPLTMFLVDDILFVNPFSIKDKQFSYFNTPNLLAISLRLHDGVTECYATGEQSEIPKFTKKCVWNWKQASGDWAYPMSVDGNIYKTDLIKQILPQIKFNNPNILEATLDQVKNSNGIPQYECCYPDGPRLINIPANKVQNVFPNKFADGLSAEDLNELFLQNKKIAIDTYQGIKPKTVHVPIEISIENL